MHTLTYDRRQTLFLSLLKCCKRGKRLKWVIELRRLLKDRVKEEQRRWNRGDIFAYRLQLKGWYPDGEIRERRDKGERGHWKWRGAMGEWKRGWKWIPRWLCREGEDSSSCRFSDEEIVIEGKHMNAGSIDVYSSWCSVKDWLHCCVLWSQPAERYHQPGMNSGQRKKGGDWWGKVRCLGVSQCHQLLVKEMKVKQMKWPTEWKLCAKLAPNKQTSVFFFLG